MQINITARHLHVSDSMKSHIKEKFENLERFYDLLQHTDVVLFEEKGRNTVEATAKAIIGGQFVAKAEHDHMRAAVDLVVEKLEKQLTKQKQKLKGHKKGAREGRPWSREEKVEGDEPTYEEIVENY